MLVVYRCHGHCIYITKMNVGLLLIGEHQENVGHTLVELRDLLNCYQLLTTYTIVVFKNKILTNSEVSD